MESGFGLADNGGEQAVRYCAIDRQNAAGEAYLQINLQPSFQEGTLFALWLSRHLLANFTQRHDAKEQLVFICGFYRIQDR